MVTPLDQERRLVFVDSINTTAAVVVFEVVAQGSIWVIVVYESIVVVYKQISIIINIS